MALFGGPPVHEQVNLLYHLMFIRSRFQHLAGRVVGRTRRYGSIAGPVAVVSGGSRGIGKAIALDLLRHNYKVAILGRTDKISHIASELAAEARVDESHSHGFVCDVRDSKLVDNTLDSIFKTIGTPSLLVNSAGIAIDSLLVRMKDEDLHDMVATNLLGTIWLSRGVVKQMIRDGQTGCIVSIGSVIGSIGQAGQVGYSATKSALVGMTLSMAKELASRNIRVNLIAPGFVETDMTAPLLAQRAEAISKTIPLKRIGTVHDVVKAVKFVVENEYITGQVITVDGGLSL